MNPSTSPAPFYLHRTEAFIRGENILAIVSERSFDEVAARLEVRIACSTFTLLHVHDFGRVLLDAGTELGHRSRVYEVFDSELMAQLLMLEPGLAHALPWRIAMHDHGDVVTVSTPMPTVVMTEFSHAASVARIARTVQSGLQRVLRGVQ